MTPPRLSVWTPRSIPLLAKGQLPTFFMPWLESVSQLYPLDFRDLVSPTQHRGYPEELLRDPKALLPARNHVLKSDSAVHRVAVLTNVGVPLVLPCLFLVILRVLSVLSAIARCAKWEHVSHNRCLIWVLVAGGARSGCWCPVI